MHKYKIRYELSIEDESKGYTKDEAEEKGLTDGLLLFSVLFPEDGSYSQQAVFSYNGVKRRPFTQDETFRLWMTLGLGLHDNGELEGWKNEIITVYADLIRKIYKRD